MPLFNPRRQEWSIHFEWSPDSLLIVGLTSTGRGPISPEDNSAKRVFQIRLPEARQHYFSKVVPRFQKDTKYDTSSGWRRSSESCFFLWQETTGHWFRKQSCGAFSPSCWRSSAATRLREKWRVDGVHPRGMSIGIETLRFGWRSIDRGLLSCAACFATLETNWAKRQCILKLVRVRSKLWRSRNDAERRKSKWIMATSKPKSTATGRATKAAKVLREARKLAPQVKSWADFTNALFDPHEGVVAKIFSDADERRAFVKSAEYREIDRLLAGLMQRFGLAEGATPKKSGKFVIRLPKTLHFALEREAAHEGVSLNQLVVAKLAISLSQSTSISFSRPKVIRAGSKLK